jgi:hypothetical protein
VFTVPSGEVVLVKGIVCNTGPGATSLSTITVSTSGGVPALVASASGASVLLEKQLWVALAAGDTIVWNRTVPSGGYATCWVSGARLLI